jgi:hypothetical protein
MLGDKQEESMARRMQWEKAGRGKGGLSEQTGRLWQRGLPYEGEYFTKYRPKAEVPPPAPSKTRSDPERFKAAMAAHPELFPPPGRPFITPADIFGPDHPVAIAFAARKRRNV